MRAPDWGRGRYEDTASALLPAARAVVRAAALCPGERVLDVGCGTGNAALLAAGAGARVIGIDPASRLLEVAQGQAVDEGSDTSFLPCEADCLPVPAASVDVALSAFAVIFASELASGVSRFGVIGRCDGILTEERADFIGGVAGGRGHDVAVDVHRHGDRGMPE
ncbi:class I SAM-dependent methyltransferase [Frankia sp. Cas4]|uniref:class I SAM-dependent methyltransferase n=1 Tax=Frankia sp. Cas4 TaxID=3073927 RepID=UPI002AD314B2|nr:methyltransferase domain-containing protein [Frankia sp. Cas4]